MKFPLAMHVKGTRPFANYWAQPNQQDEAQYQLDYLKTQQSGNRSGFATRGTKMEFANRVVSAAIKASNNNTVVNVFLVGSFVALGVRSVNQQRDIEALEAQKDSLIQSNKAMKKTMWDWKQQLFAEASSAGTALVPLARLKAIYGEAPESQIVDALKEDAKSPASKLVI